MNLVSNEYTMIEKKLEYFINNEKALSFKGYDLNAITKLLKRFGDPHNRITTIHIAGTNGKGSIAHMLKNIFVTAGYNCGLYTSPHLLRVNERICINDTLIDDETMLSYIDDICTLMDSESPPSYFDVLTVIAFRYFFDRNIDIAIIETGLGGRLDSTNVITPVCSVICDISLDHIHVLGDTIEKITFEKAGIIKKQVPVITTNTDENILSVLKTKSSELNCIFLVNDHDFIVNNIKRNGPQLGFDYHAHFASISIRNISLPLVSDFQIKNSSAAISAALVLMNSFPLVNENSIRNGLKNITIPGRMKKLCDSPLVFFDPAHNVSAIQNITSFISQEYPNKKIVYIISLMRDKDYVSILQHLRAVSKSLIYFELPDERCYKPSLENQSLALESIKDESNLEKRVHMENPDDILFFFTGSFRLYQTALYITKSFPG